jgi:hypothetical protein
VYQAKALIELDRRPEALSCLAQAYSLHDRNGKTRNGATGAELFENFEELVKSE